MNELNVGTREACQRLQAAGIVVETEAVWQEYPLGKWSLQTKEYHDRFFAGMATIPALSMAEAWRELPVQTVLHKNGDGTTSAIYIRSDIYFNRNSNPTDALIDLLIFVK